MSEFDFKYKDRDSRDAEPDLTPYERLWADNVDLCARLRLADERAFEQAAEIARLRSQIELMRRG